MPVPPDAVADLRASGLFDDTWYRVQSRIPLLGDPAAHYLRHGSRRGRRPHPFFDGRFYALKNPGAVAGGTAALLHYVREGWRAGLSPHPDFEPAWYAGAADLTADDGDPLRHFIEKGHAAGLHPGGRVARNPSPLFERIFRTPAGGAAWAADDHQVRIESGGRAGSIAELLGAIRAHPLEVPPDFNPEGYARLNADMFTPTKRFLAEAPPLLALTHYLTKGRRRGHVYDLDQRTRYLRPPDAPPVPGAEALADVAEARVCCLLHVFYPEILDELLPYLETLGVFQADFFVNVAEPVWGSNVESWLAQHLPGATVIRSPNTGRDIGGFVRLAERIDLDAYDVACLMHTKKSPHVHSEAAARWREDLLRALLADEATARRNIAAFLADPTLGQIAASARRDTNLSWNWAGFTRLLNRYGVTGDARHCEFVAGTMMLIRPAVVARLAAGARGLAFEAGDNRSQLAHKDGQIAHAMERLIGSLVRDAGLKCLWL